MLIADEYHLVMCSRERGIRALAPHPTLELHLEELMRGGFPPAVVAFDTREEAKAWLASQAEPPGEAVIQIGGEYYLAVYYRNINYRALFPFSGIKSP